MSNCDIKVKQRYSKDFRRAHSTGAIGGFDGYDFTLTFFQENVKHQEDPRQPPTIHREFVAEVVLSPIALKEIARWLLQNVNEIEEKHGLIRGPSLLVQTKQGEGHKPSNKTLTVYS